MCTGTNGDYWDTLGVAKHNFSANIPHPMEDDKTGKLVQINRKWQMFLLLIWSEQILGMVIILRPCSNISNCAFSQQLLLNDTTGPRVYEM